MPWLVATILLPAQPQVVEVRPPIAAYGFNRIERGNTPDSSDRRRHATVVNAALTAGRFGKGVEFNGTNAYVRIDEPGWPTGDYTYAAWVLPRSLRRWHGLIEVQTSAGAGIELAVASRGYVELWSSGALRSRGGVPVPVSAWTHVAVSRSGSLVTTYTNGVAQRVGRDSTVFDFGNCPALIGVDADRGCASRLNGFFHGVIDELKIYDRALPADEIRRTMDVPIVVAP